MNQDKMSSWTLAFSVAFLIAGVAFIVGGIDLLKGGFMILLAAAFAFLTWRFRVEVKNQMEIDARAREEAAKREEEEKRRRKEEERRAREEQERRQKEREQQRAELSARMAAFFEAIPDAVVEVSEKPARKHSVSLIDEVKFSSVTSRSNPETIGNFVAFDVETTGLSVSSAEIVEIAAIRFRNFEPVMKYQTLCSTFRGIPVQAEEINGITEEMVEDKPTFQQVAESFLAFVGQDSLVAHNLEFDLKFVVKYGADVTAEDRRYYDTLRIAQRTVPKAKTVEEPGVDNYRLGTLASYFGIPLLDAHRALADCYAVGRLFESLVKERIG